MDDPIFDWVRCPSCGHLIVAVGGKRARTRCCLCGDGRVEAEDVPMRDEDGNEIPSDPLPDEYPEANPN